MLDGCSPKIRKQPSSGSACAQSACFAPSLERDGINVDKLDDAASRDHVCRGPFCLLPPLLEGFRERMTIRHRLDDTFVFLASIPRDTNNTLPHAKSLRFANRGYSNDLFRWWNDIPKRFGLL
jgi:hypothetical protein